ncbi:NTPase [candidate division KSB1 bacterium]
MKNVLPTNMTNVMLEGKPGTGKTTLLKNCADILSSIRIGGFYTEEIRGRGTRVGFTIKTMDGHSGVLSHVSFKAGPRVGKYRVDIPAFEKIGVQSLEKALTDSDVVFIDEIGKMELFSPLFRKAVLRCLDSIIPVFATVMSGPHPFTDSIKARADVQLIKVTSENRDEIARTLLEKINAVK